MKKILILALLAAMAVGVTGCKKEDPLPPPIIIDEDTTKISEVGEDIYPGMEQTTAIIDIVYAMGQNDAEGFGNLWAYKTPDAKAADKFDELYGREIKGGIEYVNSFIEPENVKSEADIEKLNNELKDKLKGTVTQYNIVTVSVTENDEGEMKDVLMPMVFIDNAWYVLDITNI